MSIFVDKNTKVLVQGITGREGQFHTRQCVAYGTRVVAGVTPARAARTWTASRFSTRATEAVAETGANCSLIFVPPAFAADAILEAADRAST
jgi:succinyl-CoA synthetase alpha subunit